ncbi:MAG TPA: M1 family aminopeptidase [Thermoanaerobaculia bacterium]|nr:M1 family aminopeptidase [Thermoanaerobaculia bacterium]
MIPGPSRASLRTAALVSLLAPALSGAETFSVQVDRYAHPTLGKDAAVIANATLQVGHMKVTLAKGVVAPVLAGTEPIGFFFKGNGSWRYVSATVEEYPVMRHDADKATHWKARDEQDGLAVTDSFDDLLWLAPGEKPPAGTTGAAIPENAFRHHLEAFARRKSDSVAQRLAYRARASPSAAFSWVEFSGGKQESIWFRDEVESHAEDLIALKKLEFDSANAPWEWAVETISDQPIGRSFREPPQPEVVLTRVEPEIEAAGEHAKIRVAETWENATKEPISTLHVNLRSRVFADSALDIRRNELLKVETAGGHAVDFDHRDGRLLLALPTPIEPGRSVTLAFDMEGNVLPPPSHDSYWLLGFDSWFPSPGLNGSDFTCRLKVRVKKPFVPIASGAVVARREEKDWNSLETELDHPIFLPVVLAGSYHVEDVVKDGRAYHVASYAYVNHRATEHLVTLASQIIKFYEPFLGPFPWKEFTIVEINSYGFGVAPPGTMFITREAFSPHEDDLTTMFSKSLTARFAHEIAHQWWGHQIKWPDDEEEWMSESFAEYCSALQVRAQKGNGAYNQVVRDWEGRMKDSGVSATLPTANRIEGETAFRDRFGLLYGRGPFLLAVIHREIGEEKFLTFLKTFQSNRKWRTGSSALTADLLRFLTGRSWTEFFDRYFWSTEWPTLPR